MVYAPMSGLLIGGVPLNDSPQLVLRCALSRGSREWEVTVDQDTTVARCCSIMAQTAGLEGQYVLVCINNGRGKQ